MKRKDTKSSRPLAVLLAVSITLMGGCGSSVTDDKKSGPSAETEGTTEYPLTVESCGVTQTFEAAPAAAVTLTSTATETMLELGLGDKLVGTAYLGDRKIGEEYREEYNKIAVLADRQPSMEQILAVEPDFVYAGYPDGFSETTGHTREQLQNLGILTHLSPVGCTDEPKELDDVPEELALIGKIFDVGDAAAAAIEEFNARVEEVESVVKDADRPSVFLYNSGADAPTTVGGWAYPSVMIEAAGGANIFADEALRWGKVSWEQVAVANPDIIVIYDYLDPSVESKIATLNSIPAIANTTAILEQNFAVVSLSNAQPGPRSAEGIEILAEQFHPDLFSDN